jgi:hypothetical protein
VPTHRDIRHSIMHQRYLKHYVIHHWNIKTFPGGVVRGIVSACGANGLCVGGSFK